MSAKYSSQIKIILVIHNRKIIYLNIKKCKNYCTYLIGLNCFAYFFAHINWL